MITYNMYAMLPLIQPVVHAYLPGHYCSISGQSSDVLILKPLMYPLISLIVKI